MGFFSRLEERARQIDSLLCVGIDPYPEDIQSLFGEVSPTRLVDFCTRLIEATAVYAVAFKPNAAFFEAFGAEGFAALQKVIAAVPDEIPVILDVKRGDIATTAQAYARACFDALGADAITVNPFLGRDAVEPFIMNPQKGVFLLCKTSNPGSADLQDLFVFGGGRLYETIARLAVEWNRHQNIGLVVGATQPEALARIRELAPDLWIMAPGVGIQGGDLQKAMEAGLREDGWGLLVPVSRSLSRSEHPQKTAAELREALRRQRESLWQAKKVDRTSIQTMIASKRFSSLANGLLETGCIKFGRFTLRSGLQSPIYIDLRRLVAYPQFLAQIAEMYLPLLRQLSFTRLAAIPYAALPIATAISLQSGFSVIYPRKDVKSYGTRAEVEGVYNPGERVVVIDDLATTGGSILEAIERLTAAGLQVNDVVVLIDRESGAKEALTQAGFTLHAVCTLSQLLDYWERAKRVPATQIAEVRRFLDST